MVQIIAHRGGLWPETTENTLAAFQRCVQKGIQWVEIDIRASSDGELFISHDADLSRVAGMNRAIRSLTAHHIDRIPLYTGDSLTRLTTALEEFPNAYFNVDIKDDFTVPAFIRFLQTTSWVSRLRVASFSAARLRGVRSAVPDVRSSLGVSEVGKLWVSSHMPRPLPRLLRPLVQLRRSRKSRLHQAHEAGMGRQGERLDTMRVPECVDAIQVPEYWGGIPVVTHRFLREAHTANLEVHVWTVNDLVQAKRLYNMGVDGLVTDFPVKIRNELI